MLDHESFLKTIADRPDDPAPRLVYADWLEEHGDTHRAEYLRLDCERVALPAADPRRRQLAQRIMRLYADHGRDWLRPPVTAPAQDLVNHLGPFFRLAPVCDLSVELTDFTAPLEAVELIPESVARENLVFPLCPLQSPFALVRPRPLATAGTSWLKEWDRQRDPRTLTVASAVPFGDGELIEKLEFILNCTVLWVRTDSDQLQTCLDRHYGTTVTESVDCVLYEFPDVQRDWPLG